MKRVLVIEDDELFREAIRDYLTEDYKVDEVGSAREALSFLAESGADVVLLDINLPDLSGMALLPQIKKNWPVLPVVMMTAVDTIPQVVEAIKKGAFDYLAKPINAQELLVAIERAIEASELQSEVAQRRNLQLVSNRAVRLPPPA